VTTSAIQVSPTLNQTGAWAVEVKNPDGGQAVPFGFTVAAAAPSISSLNSTHYASSNSNQTMLINGNNFQSGDTLTFVPPEGGTISSTASKLTFVSTTQLSYQFNDASDIGPWSVTVNSPDGSKHSAAWPFSVP
jgi:hypothetical protein